MDETQVMKAKETIAKAIGFEKSELEPDYYNCGHWGLHLLMFDTDWSWLMFAVKKIQENHKYRLQEEPYNIKRECILLARFIEQHT